MKENFYQIQLLKKGNIEIFQNVFNHYAKAKNGEVKGITILYSPSKNTGIYTASYRPIEEVYDIRILNDPLYHFTHSFPTKSNKITIH